MTIHLILRIFILIIIVSSAIIILTYAAHKKSDGKDPDGCQGTGDCSGDCLNCGRTPEKK